MKTDRQTKVMHEREETAMCNVECWSVGCRQRQQTEQIFEAPNANS